MPQNEPLTDPLSGPNTSPKLILIGEDDLDDQELFREIFSTMECELRLEFMPNGLMVMKYLQENSGENLPCLILLDYNMPEMSGADILENLAGDSRLTQIPKVIWSTSNSKVYRKQCLDLGASAYITKPSSVTELKEVAAYLLSLC